MSFLLFIWIKHDKIWFDILSVKFSYNANKDLKKKKCHYICFKKDFVYNACWICDPFICSKLYLTFIPISSKIVLIFLFWCFLYFFFAYVYLEFKPYFVLDLPELSSPDFILFNCWNGIWEEQLFDSVVRNEQACI